jgi:predicted nicotinamide N-methyase
MGGATAPLDMATSACGIADVVAARAGSRSHAFVDWSGADLAW